MMESAQAVVRQSSPSDSGRSRRGADSRGYGGRLLFTAVTIPMDVGSIMVVADVAASILSFHMLRKYALICIPHLNM